MADAARPVFTAALQVTSAAERRAGMEASPTAELTFTIPAQLPFGSAADYIAAFRDVAGRVAKQDITEALIPLWMVAEATGNPDLAVAALTPLTHDRISFRWPAFDAVRARFLQAGDFPERWAHLAEAAKDRRLALRQEAVRLLAHTLAATICNRCRARQLAAITGRRAALDIRDPATMQFVRDREAHLDLADPATLPPYFPGDTTGLRADRSR
jgi:hypothetical protein